MLRFNFFQHDYDAYIHVVLKYQWELIQSQQMIESILIQRVVTFELTKLQTLFRRSKNMVQFNSQFYVDSSSQHLMKPLGLLLGQKKKTKELNLFSDILLYLKVQMGCQPLSLTNEQCLQATLCAETSVLTTNSTCKFKLSALRVLSDNFRYISEISAKFYV